MCRCRTCPLTSLVVMVPSISVMTSLAWSGRRKTENSRTVSRAGQTYLARRSR